MSDSAAPKRINLIGWDNGRGLSHDLRLLRETLESLGHVVQITSLARRRRRWRWTWRSIALRLRLIRQSSQRGGGSSWKFDANIMLEHVHVAYFGVARQNFFIPNPEWLVPRDRQHLHRFDAVLAKTRIAAATFEAQGMPTRYIGFVGTDCLMADVPRRTRFLHLAGASRMKGTARLLALWRRHPEWPPLLVVQAAKTAREMPAAPAQDNVEHRVGTIADINDIRQLQNSHAFHVCPSEAEGWGHYIIEAMSCGAVTLTCDGPPMNELVQPDRGLLVAATAAGALNLSTRYEFDEAAMEAVVERASMMEQADIDALCAAARSWFVANQQAFAGRLQNALHPLPTDRPVDAR